MFYQAHRHFSFPVKTFAYPPPNRSPLDVSILLLLTNRYNKGILLHFCQQNGKKNRKIKDFDKTLWKWPEKHFGTKKFFGA